MNVKSVLLGSIAALVTISGARAADAVVVAEPEPAEYVKICDVYGAGFFYIPGTETCLRVFGYVRVEVGGGGGKDGGRFGIFDTLVDAHDTYGYLSRFSLQTATSQETELGTLGTYTETRFNFANEQSVLGHGAGNVGPSLNFAFISLGGVTIGKTESAFTRWGNGYALALGIRDNIINYGPYDTNVIQYSHDFDNGFGIMGELDTGAFADTIDSYVPHLVAGVKYSQGPFAIQGVVGYDSNYEEWAGKVRVNYEVIKDQFRLAFMATYGSGDEHDKNYFKGWDGSYAIHGGGSYRLNEKAWFNTQISWDSAKDIGAFANVSYELTPGLLVVTEFDYQNMKDKDPTNPYVGYGEAFGGAIRIDRSF